MKRETGEFPAHIREQRRCCPRNGKRVKALHNATAPQAREGADPGNHPLVSPETGPKCCDSTAEGDAEGFRHAVLRRFQYPSSILRTVLSITRSARGRACGESDR